MVRRPPRSKERAVHCPFCRHPDSRVVDSRTSDDGSSIRRRRQCPNCNRRFTTVETASLSVVKRSGATEPFSREKIVNGVRKACQGRPVSEDDLAILAQRVEETLRSSGSAEIDAYEIGLAILGPLRDLDEVAYLRFASVYQAFDSLEDFEAAITVLRAERGQEGDDGDVAASDAQQHSAADDAASGESAGSGLAEGAGAGGALTGSTETDGTGAHAAAVAQEVEDGPRSSEATDERTTVG
jgi:transcriptional repressor NrdR